MNLKEWFKDINNNGANDVNTNLIRVTENYKDLLPTEVGEVLDMYYKTKGKFSAINSTFINSIFTDRKIVFTISLRSMESLLELDNNNDRSTINGRLWSEWCNNELTKFCNCLAPTIGKKPSLWELKEPLLVTLLNKVISKDIRDIQYDNCLKYLQKFDVTQNVTQNVTQKRHYKIREEKNIIDNSIDSGSNFGASLKNSNLLPEPSILAASHNEVEMPQLRNNLTNIDNNNICAPYISSSNAVSDNKMAPRINLNTEGIASITPPPSVDQIISRIAYEFSEKEIDSKSVLPTIMNNLKQAGHNPLDLSNGEKKKIHKILCPVTKPKTMDKTRYENWISKTYDSIELSIAAYLPASKQKSVKIESDMDSDPRNIEHLKQLAIKYGEK